MAVRDQLRDFIKAELLMDPEGTPLDDQTRILEEALIDSLGIFRLASFVEQSHGIPIRDADMVPENFGSIESLARFIEERRRTA